MNRIVRFISTAYSFLLRLYPKAYRKEFAEEMLLDFSDMAIDAGRKGKFSLALFCIRELVDFPANLLRIHLEDGQMFKMLRFPPVNFGLRGALAYGIVFVLSLPINLFMYQKLFFWLDSFVTRLQVFYYDRFHVEQRFDWISWIPTALSSLLTGLILGVLLALLFADRSKYARYMLVSTLGWFLYHMVSNILAFFNFWVFLDNNQYIYFDYMMLAFSGTVLGLIFVVVNSERRHALRWLTLGVFVYPLFTYLWVDQLFDLLVFQSLWRFAGLTILLVILVASAFLAAIKLDSEVLPVMIAGTFGFPLVRPLMTFALGLFAPSTFTPNLNNVWIIITNAIYGVLFGLLLGIMLGFQNKSESRQIAA